MRISDWSSDVCSSDLLLPFVVQAEDIGRTFQPAQFEKFLNALFAQALYVHCPTADKMDQPLHPLSVADEAPGAAIVYLPLFPHGFRTAIGAFAVKGPYRSEEHTSELQSLMRISYAVFCLKKKTKK